MAYHMNSALFCAATTGIICFIIEAVAFAHDINFTLKIEQGLIFTRNDSCQFIAQGLSDEELANRSNSSDHRDVDLLRRDLPFQALFIIFMSLTIILIIISTTITAKFWDRKHGKLVRVMNKCITFVITILFAACSSFLVFSVVAYDLKYIEFNDGRPLGCNFGYHHEYKLDSYCDRKYGVCQRKTLKLTASVMSLMCMILAIIGIMTEMRIANYPKELRSLMDADGGEKELQTPVGSAVVAIAKK